MSAQTKRARLLMGVGRNDEALEVLNKAIASSPEVSELYGLAALCCRDEDQRKALDYAKRAAELRPDWSWPHFVLAIVTAKSSLKQSLKHLGVALALDPGRSRYHSLQAELLCAQRRWKPALKAVDTALEIDPESEYAQDVRAKTLTYLGKSNEARNAARLMVAQNPDSSTAHSRLGWTSLHFSDRRSAAAHFIEALRLDAMDERARHGLLESLRAAFPPYRLLLKIRHELARIPIQAQFFMFIGLRILIAAGRQQNQTSLVLKVLGLAAGIAFGGFLVLRWLGEPITDSLLLFHRLGRLAIGPERRLYTKVFLAYLAAAAILLALGLFRSNLIIGAGLATIFAILLALALQVKSGRNERAATFWTIAAIGALITVAAVFLAH